MTPAEGKPLATGEFITTIMVGNILYYHGDTPPAPPPPLDTIPGTAVSQETIPGATVPQETLPWIDTTELAFDPSSSSSRSEEPAPWIGTTEFATPRIVQMAAMARQGNRPTIDPHPVDTAYWVPGLVEIPRATAPPPSEAPTEIVTQETVDTATIRSVGSMSMDP